MSSSEAIRAANPTPQAWPAGAFSFAKLKRCRVMDVLRLVATSTARDGTISGPVVVLIPDGAVIFHHPVTP